MPNESLASLSPAALSGFGILSADAMALLQGAVRELILAKNDMLLKEGQRCTAIYFVVSGLLRSWYNQDGLPINLHFALENTFTTNLQQLRSGLPSVYNIQAAEPTLVLAIEKERLMQLYQQSPEISAWGRAILEKLLDEQERQAQMFRLQSAKERYEFMVTHNPRLLQRVSLTQISSYLGISRETLSRIRK